MQYHYRQFIAGLKYLKTGKKILKMINILGAITPQNIAKIEDLIGDDPNISIRVIQDKIGISKDSIGNILHNELNVHKICKKWVSHILTDENKKKLPDNY